MVLFLCLVISSISYTFRTVEGAPMASIQKVKNKRGISYRVIIRKSGQKPISKTFKSKTLAHQFISEIELSCGDNYFVVAFPKNGSSAVGVLFDGLKATKYFGFNLQEKTTHIEKVKVFLGIRRIQHYPTN